MQGDLSTRYLGHALPVDGQVDDELTRVGRGTTCGAYLRTAWQPVCLSSQLGNVPLSLRILGEDLVAFRDGSGAIGLLHRHCSHRGASLEFGIVMHRGLSCCYHGWTYDTDGTVLDAPGEPAGNTIGTRIRHGAYPCQEVHGLVFAYLGDPRAVPPLPVLDVTEQPGVTPAPFSLAIPCNWLQVYENSQDPVHVVFLHARIAGAHFDESNSAMQELDFLPTPLGMMNVQTRRWGARLWTRTVECILPNLNQTGAIWEDAAEDKVFQRVGLTRWIVPIDDTNSLQIGWRHLAPHLDPNGKDRPEQIGLEMIDFEGQDAGRSYAERQRRPGDYDAQVSQRPIAVHELEHLASSDRGVAMLRRLIRRGIRAFAEGTLPSAVGPTRLSTFCQDTITRIDEAADDIALRRAHGQAVATAVLETANLAAEARSAHIAASVSALLHSQSYTQGDVA